MKPMCKRKEVEALREALAGREALGREETARAVEKLAPHIARASARLMETRAERRSLRLQAWGLAGCSAAFAALAWLIYRNWSFLLAEPARWAPLAAFAALILLTVCCLPLILIQKGENHHA